MNSCTQPHMCAPRPPLSMRERANLSYEGGADDFVNRESVPNTREVAEALIRRGVRAQTSEINFLGNARWQQIIRQLQSATYPNPGVDSPHRWTYVDKLVACALWWNTPDPASPNKIGTAAQLVSLCLVLQRWIARWIAEHTEADRGYVERRCIPEAPVGLASHAVMTEAQLNVARNYGGAYLLGRSNISVAASRRYVALRVARVLSAIGGTTGVTAGQMLMNANALANLSLPPELWDDDDGRVLCGLISVLRAYPAASDFDARSLANLAMYVGGQLPALREEFPLPGACARPLLTTAPADTLGRWARAGAAAVSGGLAGASLGPWGAAAGAVVGFLTGIFGR